MCSPWRCTNRKYVCTRRPLKVMKEFPSPKYFQIIWNQYQIRSAMVQNYVTLTHVNTNISNAKQKTQRHDLLLNFIHLLSLPCILNCSHLHKFSSGFTFEVLIIFTHRKGCDRMTLSATQGKLWSYLISATNKSKWRGEKKVILISIQ